GTLLERWSEWTPSRQRLTWSAERCRESWSRGVPLLAEAAPPLDRDDIEELLGAAMEDVAAVDPARGPGLQRLAAAWDAAAVGPEGLPARWGGIGGDRVEGARGLGTGALAFLGYAEVGPAVDGWLAAGEPAFEGVDWGRGVCPFCGAPPGFVDVVEG